MTEQMENQERKVSIKVIGVGGGGCNAVDNMIGGGVGGVDYVVANTDCQALDEKQAATKIQLGLRLTRGEGAGGDPAVGRDAAEESAPEIAEAIGDASMVFVAAGMGGGTGTGAAPVIARIARERGALTVGVVTRPFAFEGKRRSDFAEAGIAEMVAAVDTLVVIPNQRIFSIIDGATTVLDAFTIADGVLRDAVRGIADLLCVHGVINLDFGDLKAVMASQGMALIGLGEAEGEDRTARAAAQAIDSPLLDDISVDGSTAVLLTVAGGNDLTLLEAQSAAEQVREAAHPEAAIYFGLVIDPALEGSVRITVVATGFDGANLDELLPARPNARVRHLVAQTGGEGVVVSGPVREEFPTQVQKRREAIAQAQAQAQARVQARAQKREEDLTPLQSARKTGFTREVFAFAQADDDPFDIPTFLRK